jgi:type IV pilus assembly protein PilW
LSPLAENIDAINFVYLDGANPTNVLATPVPASNLSDIRSIQITVVARSGQNLPGLFYQATDDRIYRNQQGTIILDMSAAPDTFRRQLLTAEVRCRNLGL